MNEQWYAAVKRATAHGAILHADINGAEVKVSLAVNRRWVAVRQAATVADAHSVGTALLDENGVPA